MPAAALAQAIMGHDTNTAHFSIMMGPAPHLNGDYTIFGERWAGLGAVRVPANDVAHACSNCRWAAAAPVPPLLFFPASLTCPLLLCPTPPRPPPTHQAHTHPARPYSPARPAGQAVSGLDVIDAINALSKGKPDNTATQDDGAQIADSGQLRNGSIVPDLSLGL